MLNIKTMSTHSCVLGRIIYWSAVTNYHAQNICNIAVLTIGPHQYGVTMTLKISYYNCLYTAALVS